MRSVSSAPNDPEKRPELGDPMAAIELAHSIAGPIVQGLAALYDLGRRIAALEDADPCDEAVIVESATVVAAARRVADLCSVAARGCVIGTDPSDVQAAMRLVVETITNTDELAKRTDGAECWSLVPD